MARQNYIIKHIYALYACIWASTVFKNVDNLFTINYENF